MYIVRGGRLGLAKHIFRVCYFRQRLVAAIQSSADGFYVFGAMLTIAISRDDAASARIGVTDVGYAML